MIGFNPSQEVETRRPCRLVASYALFSAIPAPEISLETRLWFRRSAELISRSLHPI